MVRDANGRNDSIRAKYVGRWLHSGSRELQIFNTRKPLHFWFREKFRYNYDIATPYLSRDKIWVHKMLDEQKSKIKHRGKYIDSKKIWVRYKREIYIVDFTFITDPTKAKLNIVEKTLFCKHGSFINLKFIYYISLL